MSEWQYLSSVKQIPSFLLILVAFKGIISIVGLLEPPHILKGSFFLSPNSSSTLPPVISYIPSWIIFNIQIGDLNLHLNEI